MPTFTLAAASLNQTPLDWRGNAGRIRRAFSVARDKGVNVLALPELAISGYGCEDMFLFRETWDKSLQSLFDLLPETRGLVTILGLPLRVGGSTFNAVAVVADGDLLGFVCKQHSGFSGANYDARWFAPWPAHSRFELELNGQSFPVGDLTFMFDGVRLGVEFCDLPDDDVAETLLASERNGAIVINPSVSCCQLEKFPKRRHFLQQRSMILNTAYLTANLHGVESGGMIYDGSAFVIARGEVLSQTQRFSFADMQTAVSSFDVKDNVQGNTIVDMPDDATCDEFARAISLGLLDYMRKTRAGGLTLSLSGGADSAAIATLVWLGVQFAVHELGLEGFIARFRDVKNIDSAKSVNDIMARLLTTVYQRTQNSSDTTYQAAKSLANAIGAAFYEFDVEPIVQAYTQMVEQQIGRSLTWKTDDIPLQNIQARVRVPGVWMLANLSGSLLLSTGNRSEASVGYTTMDGDTCGGLAPLSGIDKYFLRNWLRWMEQTGAMLTSEPCLSLPVLKVINDQKPTAELRPASATQMDETDLMPYEILNLIEGWFVRDRLSQAEILARLEEKFTNHPKEQLAAWLERFHTLWCRNQWKREKAAPGFHIDTYNLSPRSYFRFPVISREIPERFTHSFGDNMPVW
jgi:NAD+ synthase (glutamine-hydrolysing)